MKFDFFIEILFPSACLSCSKKTGNGNFICEDCRKGVRIAETYFCGQCGARIPDGSKMCHKNFPYILAAATDYADEPVKNLVQGLKFRYVEKAAEHLADIISEYMLKLPKPKGFMLMPIPLGQARMRERGFNQAELIAREVASRLSLPMRTDILYRSRNTPAQTELAERRKRRENVRNCFAVENPEEVWGKNVILLDDVTTTGATFEEAARALKRAGAKKIIALAAAKA